MATMKADASFSILTGNNIDALPFKAGSIIFREGDEARDLFVIKSGEVRIQIGNRTITELGPDSIFGEMALIDNEPAQRDRGGRNRRRTGAGVGKAILVFGQPDPLFRPQGHARAGSAAEENQQDVRLNGSACGFEPVVTFLSHRKLKTLDHDAIEWNRIMISSICLSMISAQTRFRVC